MAASAKLSGETMIVRHIPLAHGQSVGFQLYSPVQKPVRPCSLKLTHSISLPEREEPPKEALDSDFQSHQSHSSKSSSNDDTGGRDSSPGFQLKFSQDKIDFDFTGSRSTPRWQNPFLPELEVHDDEEEDDDSDGDNLHRYREGSSFQLHGNSNRAQDEAMGYTTGCSDTDTDLFRTSIEHKPVKNLLDSSGLQHRRDSKSTPILMDCEEQEWSDQEDYNEYLLKERSCKNNLDDNYAQPKTSDSDSSTQKQPSEYISDSSCNSSDGVLVNFSAIYNKTNNAVPATPHDLDSPANQSHGSGSTPKEDGPFKPIRCWSPCGVDPNCNIYLLGSDGLPSLEISDLADCLQSQGRLMSSTQNYYKLVTCDLSSQSSLSPAWSSVTSCSEGHSQGSTTPPKEYFLFRQLEGNEGDTLQEDPRDHQVDENIELQIAKNTRDPSKSARERKYPKSSKGPEAKNHKHIHPAHSQSWYGQQNCCFSPKLDTLPRISSCPGHINLEQCSSQVPKHHTTSFAELARCKKAGGDLSSVESSMEAPTCSRFTQSTSPTLRKAPLGLNSTVITSQETRMMGSSEMCEMPSTSEGACAPPLEVVRYSKAQRPTFLPIQPFVLQPPSGKQHSKGLGSLLNQYISHKHCNPSASKRTGKCKNVPSYLRPSPLGSYSSIHLEAATSSDTCSTCTPSPVQPQNQSHWAQPSPLLVQNYPEPDQTLSSPNTLDPKLEVMSSSLQESSLEMLLTMEPLQEPYSEAKPSKISPSFVLKEVPRTQEHSNGFIDTSSPAITSVTSLTSDASLKSQGLNQRDLQDVAPTEKDLSTTSTLFKPKNQPGFQVAEQRQQSDSCSMTDGPPEEFCLSPDASSQFMSIDLLQKKGMLKSVGLAVESITAHFSPSRDPEEKIRLGNSLLSPAISQLVLGQLCPAIKNILQDGLKAFKLDLIVGQRRNKPWSVVEALTQPGASTRVLHSLVSVVRKCSQLTNHSVRVNAFLMGLLNLRALESWFLHLHASVDVVEEYYRPWAFLALSQGPAGRSLFQELLLILEPLNQLPFDLHLLSEVRLQRRTSHKPSRSLDPSDHRLLQKPSVQKNDRPPERPFQRERCRAAGGHTARNFRGCSVKFCKQPEPKLLSPEDKEEDEQRFVCLVSSSERGCAGWWLSQTPVTEGVLVGTGSGSVPQRQNGDEDEDIVVETSETEAVSLVEISQQDKPHKELRWARLFGSAIGTPAVVQQTQPNNSQTQRSRLPSQWLKLGASQVDLLAQSVWGRESANQRQ
ncbi:iporin [Astyanax mexicanus]|uniref:Iporin n=1 Tax=Astyanax mexicanus TaxID=7994 RepID=A0A8T2KXE2_ASTMX|nr:iporin [Astyanax mexicanus]